MLVRCRCAARRSRALVVVGHAWVLHRVDHAAGVVGRASRSSSSSALYQARDAIAAGRHDRGEHGAGRVRRRRASRVASIDITGQIADQRDRHLHGARRCEPQISTLNFDAEAARARLAALPAIEDATVRKIYPGKVDRHHRREGAGRALAGRRRSPISSTCRASRSRVDSGNYPELPLVVGEGANDDALIMLKAMERYAVLKKDLAALSRIGDRRWDLIYYTGLRVQLPETRRGAGARPARRRTRSDYALLDRDVTLIDLRVPGPCLATSRAIRERRPKTRRRDRNDHRRDDRPPEAGAARPHDAPLGARYRLDQDLLRHRAADAAPRGQGAQGPHAHRRGHRLRLWPVGRASRAASSPISRRPSRRSAPSSAWPSAPPGSRVQSVIVNVTAGRLGSETFSADRQSRRAGGREGRPRARAARGQRALGAAGALDRPRAADRLRARRPEGHQGSARHGGREARRRCRGDLGRDAGDAQHRARAPPLPPADRGAGRDALCIGPRDAGRRRGASSASAASTSAARRRRSPCSPKGSWSTPTPSPSAAIT